MTLTAEGKAARAAARQAATAAGHERLRETALRVANRLPPEYQSWGSNRTRAWEMVSARLRGLARRKHIRSKDIKKAMAAVRSINDLTVEQCVALLNCAPEVERPDAVEA